MIRIKNMNEIRHLPECAAKRSMVANAAFLSETYEGILNQMEKEFDGPLGGDWYLYEQNDDPSKFNIDDGYAIDLLSDEWNWCDFADLDSGGCYHIFWGTNNAGGPSLFVPDEPWVPTDLKERLEELIVSCNAEDEGIYGGRCDETTKTEALSGY